MMRGSQRRCQIARLRLGCGRVGQQKQTLATMNYCLIVCERHGQWAAALRSLTPEVAERLVETRSFTATEEALAANPQCFVAVQADDEKLDEVVSFLQQASQRYPRARFAVVMDRAAGAVEILFREAGAIEVVQSVLDLPRLAKLACRHADGQVGGELSLQRFVQARMPWKPATENVRDSAKRP